MSGEGRETGNREVEGPSCHWHPQREAVALCVSCGRAVCAECDRLVGYRHHCPACFSRAVSPPGWGQIPCVPPLAPGTGSLPPPPTIPSPPPTPPGYRPIAPRLAVHTGVETREPEDPRERRWWRADWKLSEVTAALVVIFGVYNLVGVALFLATDNPLFYEYLAYALFFCPLILLCALWIVRRHGRGREELGLLWDRPWRTLFFGLGGSVAALLMSYAAFFAVYFFFYLLAGRPPSAGETEQLRGIGGGELALVIAVAVLLAPVFEEIFFRGLFYSSLRRRLGPRAAVAVNGIIFGVLHFQPIYMISLVLVGMVLAYIYEKTDSLFASMTAHALYNLAVVLVALFAGW